MNVFTKQINKFVLFSKRNKTSYTIQYGWVQKRLLYVIYMNDTDYQCIHIHITVFKGKS